MCTLTRKILQSQRLKLNQLTYKQKTAAERFHQQVSGQIQLGISFFFIFSLHRIDSNFIFSIHAN